MRMLRHLVAAVLMVGLASPSAFAQQRHVVDASSLAGAVRQHVETQDTNRAALHDTFARPDVQRAASAAGIDLDRLSTAVDTLSADDLARASAAARDVNAALDRAANSATDQSLVGGASTIVISTTTIIIGLLVLILLIVALD